MADDEPALAEAERWARTAGKRGLSTIHATADHLPVLVAEYDRRGTERDVLRVQRDAVLALHRRVLDGSHDYAVPCMECGEQAWPCDTARALGL